MTAKKPSWEVYPNRMLIQKALVALGSNLKEWNHQCHAASLRLVKAGVADRVARGSCKGVGLAHSWAVLGGGCYDEDATIIDPTLWSWNAKIKGVWLGKFERWPASPAWDWLDLGMGSANQRWRRAHSLDTKEAALRACGRFPTAARPARFSRMEIAHGSASARMARRRDP